MTKRIVGPVQTAVLSMVLVFLCPVWRLHSQELAGVIAGQVVDETDKILPGARVVIADRQSGRTATVVTDGSGSYRIEVTPGVYAVRFELSGFARQEVARVEVHLGRTVSLSATLRVGSVTETVDVTSETTPMAHTRTAMVAHNVTAEEINRLPKTRTFQSIALTAPSVNHGDIEGGIQVNGASAAENVFTVDGVTTTSVINGTPRQNTVFEYIQEVQVKTTGIPAEHGGALGGVISAVTRSGGNIFTGETHYYFGGSSLNAGPVKRLVLDPADETTVGYIQDRKQPGYHHQIGGTVGGPIIRDTAFFLGSFSPGFHRRTNNYLFSSGKDKGEISGASKVIHAFGKLSLSMGPVTWYVTSLATQAYVDGSLPAYNGFGTNWISSSKGANEVNVKRGWRQMQVSTTAKADIALASSALATFRSGLFQDRYSDSGIAPVTSYSYQTAASTALGLPEPFSGPSGTQNAPRALMTTFDTTRRISINADYSHRLDGAGKHTVKGGVSYQQSLNDVDSRYPGGYVDIFWGVPAVFPGQPALRGTYGHYTVTNRGLFGKAGAGIVSLYLQDEWQVGDRLTLNVGVRAENEKVPAYRTETQKYVLDFPFGEKIAPRFGLSYDAISSGRAKLYASWGRYFDSMSYGLARSNFGGEIWCIYYRAIDDPAHPLSANLNYMPGRDLWVNGGSCRDRRRPRFDIVDPNTRPMSQHSTSAGFDFEVRAHTVATIHYVHSSLNRTIEDVVAFLNGEAVYLIGNPGEGNSRFVPALAAPLTGGGSIPMPKAKRQYDALEFGISRRFANSWFGSANLTVSRLYGNYAGLASSDEIRTPTSGVSAATAQQQAGSIAREGGNVNRGWDLDDAMFDSHGNLDVLGRLATDRPVVAKFYGACNVARHTQVGAFVYVGSGTPMSTYVNTVNQTEVFVEGRGDMGRTPLFSKTDLLVSHELAMAGNKRIRLELNVLNLFNQKTARHVFNFLNRGGGTARPSSGVDLAPFDLFKGYDYNALIRATPDGANAFDPRYGMDDLFEAGTQGQISVKVLF
jgi:carboxypeptidase family protein/TonB-dependent receptor-like protein